MPGNMAFDNHLREFPCKRSSYGYLHAKSNVKHVVDTASSSTANTHNACVVRAISKETEKPSFSLIEFQLEAD
ncbi:hypothetical protein ACOSP7_004409 [Xanthoceras sorbifolium]